MPSPRLPKIVEGVDYYLEDGKFVFTAAYHRRRGHCCNSRCRHCPYGLAPGGAVQEEPKVDVTIIGLPPRRD